MEPSTINITINGVSFVVSSGENSGFWQSLQTNDWEKTTFGILAGILKPGSIFIDIGCWEGPFTFYAASLGAEVHAIDPDASAARMLKENLELNPEIAGRIHIHNFALAEEDNPVNIFERRKFGDSASSLLSRSRDSGRSETVPGKKFETFLDENKINNADLIKMDIEGGEFIVLPGMVEALRKLNFPPLIVAFHPVYLKENYMEQKLFLRFISRMNIKLSNLAGKMSANNYSKKNIRYIINQMKDYKSITVPGSNADLLDEIMHDGMVLFK